MYTLKGIFPEPKKEEKKNFIKENMKQLKYLQGKTPKEPILTLKNAQPSRLTSSVATGSSLAPAKSSSGGQVKSSQLKSGKPVAPNVCKNNSTNSRKKYPDVPIKKGDMAEFLKRKEIRQLQTHENIKRDNDPPSTESSGRLRDIGCQTVESNFSDKSAEVTMLYSKKDDADLDSKLKASGDTNHNRSPKAHEHRSGDDVLDSEHNRSRLNAILERKDKDARDPYLPASYQKGIVPKYLRERKESAKILEDPRAEEADGNCPSGHVTLPDTERKETLRMLRNSFAELVSELNKMPVKTDTLRMRNKKMELEKQLAKLEEGIKVFSRPKVFVKIGE